MLSRAVPPVEWKLNEPSSFRFCEARDVLAEVVYRPVAENAHDARVFDFAKHSVLRAGLALYQRVRLLELYRGRVLRAADVGREEVVGQKPVVVRLAEIHARPRDEAPFEKAAATRRKYDRFAVSSLCRHAPADGLLTVRAVALVARLPLTVPAVADVQRERVHAGSCEFRQVEPKRVHPVAERVGDRIAQV